jgi:hypothetical protein
LGFVGRAVAYVYEYAQPANVGRVVHVDGYVNLDGVPTDFVHAASENLKLYCVTAFVTASCVALLNVYVPRVFL